MIVFASWRVSSFPLETFGGRMRYAPTRVHFNSQNISVSGYVGAQKHTLSQTRTRPNFPALGRGLDLLLLLFLHQGKKRRLESQKTARFPLENPSLSVYGRGVLHTPHICCRRQRRRVFAQCRMVPDKIFEGRMQYAPTACRIKYTAIHPNHDHRQSLIYTEKPRLQTSFSYPE